MPDAPGTPETPTERRRERRAAGAETAPAGVSEAAAERGVLYYCQDSKGFGHIRRTVSIAAELARRRPDVVQVMATPSRHVAEFQPPPALATLALPEWDDALRFGEAPPRTWRRWRESVTELRGAIVLAAADAFAPKVFLVDNHPTGVRVLGPTLRRLRAAEPRVELILGLRDVVDEPALVVRRWREQGIYELLEEVYDRILVYGSREIFDPTVEYRFPPAVAAKTTFCGYVKDFQARTPPAAIRARLGAGGAPYLLVTAGAGEHGADLVRAALAALRQPRLDGVVTFVVTGPRLPPTAFAEVEAAAAALPRVTLARFDDDLQSHINAADLVLTAGGYNTSCEIVGFGRRAIVVPRADHREAWTRAERFAARGLVTLLDPTRLTPKELAATIARLLAGPPPAGGLDFGGLRRAGDALTQALDR